MHTVNTARHRKHPRRLGPQFLFKFRRQVSPPHSGMTNGLLMIDHGRSGFQIHYDWFTTSPLFANYLFRLQVPHRSGLVVGLAVPPKPNPAAAVDRPMAKASIILDITLSPLDPLDGYLNDKAGCRRGLRVRKTSVVLIYLSSTYTGSAGD
jgi:hypothetical protein